ncbi:MAG: sugar ABC transporter substrate-binding protein [Acidobacteria bacterium]|nr:MAG: sugar ABC transporter substrate-binding protein [Acidobacteriota bacterium]
MSRNTDNKTSRRDFLRLAAGSAAFGPFFVFPERALASQKTLKIAKWAHFLPEFDSWFEASVAREWGKKNDTKVILDSIPVEQVYARASAEVKAGKGHDVFIFPWPPAEFQQHVIDHAEIVQQVASKHGSIEWMAHRSSVNMKTKKYFAFADSWIPAPFLFFQDYWSEVNLSLGPVHYDGLRSGGKRLREKLGIPCGLALAPSLESNITLQTLLYGFTSGVFNEAGKVIIRNARTFVALQYVKDLFQGAGTPEQLTWGPSGNVKAMLARKTSCTINAISLLRAAEKQDPEVAKKIMVTPPLKGSNTIVAVPHVTNCSVVWNFAENREGAKQFLADLIDNSKNIYEQSQGCNFPFYQKTLPDLIVRLSNDPHADPSWKYQMLKDAGHWTHYLGVPGYPTPAFMEVFNTFVIPRMFLSVVKGERSPADAMDAAAAEVQRIADKWKQV